MTWPMILVLAAAVFVGALIVFRLPRGPREAFAAALAVGIAGYATQGHPGLAGSPTAAREEQQFGDTDSVETRRKLAPEAGGKVAKWLVIADAMARNGNFGAAVGVLRGAVDQDPQNSDAWLAMANALVSHADGQLSPSALYAFDRAAKSAPDSPGPPLFLGLALAQSGRLTEGRSVWADLLGRTPADAPWREGLADRLAQLDAFIAERDAARISPP